MTLTMEATGLLSESMVRSAIYRMFALGFKYPTRQAFEHYRNGQFISELLTGMSSLSHLSAIAREEEGLAGKVGKDLEGWTFEEFETTYVATFDAGFPEPPCIPYEGIYNETTPRTETMLEVGGFYAHFGLAMSQEEGKRELPDYLCAELEFMHFLGMKEAQAREAGNPSLEKLLKGYQLAQRDFLERHMVGWLPKFSEKVQGVDGLPFYPDLARILVRFVNEEFVLLRAAVA